MRPRKTFESYAKHQRVKEAMEGMSTEHKSLIEARRKSVFAYNEEEKLKIQQESKND